MFLLRILERGNQVHLRSHQLLQSRVRHRCRLRRSVHRRRSLHRRHRGLQRRRRHRLPTASRRRRHQDRRRHCRHQISSFCLVKTKNMKHQLSQNKSSKHINNFSIYENIRHRRLDFI